MIVIVMDILLMPVTNNIFKITFLKYQMAAKKFIPRAGPPLDYYPPFPQETRFLPPLGFELGLLGSCEPPLTTLHHKITYG